MPADALLTVWISPVSQNYQGPSTPYGDAYHGYWIADATQLNDKFGTADDLKALSDELHRRGMYVHFCMLSHLPLIVPQVPHG